MAISAEEIGERIQAARQKKSYKQSYVAEKVDLSEQHLSRIENGTKPIYLHKLNMICELLDTSIVELLAANGHESAKNIFVEIIKDCSPETVQDMLNTCKVMANIEKRGKE